MSKIYLKKKTLPLILLIIVIPVILLTIWLSYLDNSDEKISPIVAGVTKCSHCGMMISDLRFAAAIRFKSEKKSHADHYYDDLGCLKNHSSEFHYEHLEGWVHSFKSEKKIPINKAWFIKTQRQTPMGSGWIAVKDKTDFDEEAFDIDSFLIDNKVHEY